MKNGALICGLMCAAHGFMAIRAADTANYAPAMALSQDRALRLILDMVHYNPGELRYQTAFADPEVVSQMGFNGKVFFLFDSPTLAVNWETTDPEVFPKGSAGRAWADALAARIDAQQAGCKAAGLKVYAMADLILFPKTLVEKHGLQEVLGDPRNPEVVRFLREMLNEVFARFPNLDGLVVRIGETYLHDAPHHVGRIDRKSDPDATIIPLIQLLRQEVCVKHDKELIFRTWVSFDTNLDVYLKVTDAIEPHAKLVFSVKHCEGDFHRPNIFSKVLGQGRHPQIVEVQSAREYEGKGAYPNYIANGVIEGFEENRDMPSDRIKSLRELVERTDSLVGLWTWSRGGGWEGPFIKNELWCELNTWVMSQWANNPMQSEESIFGRFATERLHLSEADREKFRQLCLLSAHAVLLGKNTSRPDYVDRVWSRDHYISAPQLPDDPEKVEFILRQREEAAGLWRQIVQLAGEIHFPDPATVEFVVTSCKYGESVYRIYSIATQLARVGPHGDKARLRQLIEEYDNTWAEYHQLAASSASCATLYEPIRSPWGKDKRTDLRTLVESCRAGAN